MIRKNTIMTFDKLRLLKNGNILDENRIFRNCHCESQAKQSRYLSEIASVASLPRNDVDIGCFSLKISNLKLFLIDRAPRSKSHL